MRSRFRPMLVLLVASGGLLVVGNAMADFCRDVSPRTLEDFDAPGTHAVGVRTLTFVDPTRPTPPNGTFPGAPERTLVTEIWYPAAQAGRDAAIDSGSGPYPVIVYSHGGGGSRLEAVLVGQHLASRGMIVAAPDYPLTNLGAPGGPTADDLRNQPGDWSFVLDGVLAEFGAAVDPQRVGATGHSLGGLTTLLVTYHRDLRDPRIRAALAMAPAACFLTRRFFRDAQAPLLIMHGDSDQLSTYRLNGHRAFADARRPRYLVRLENGSHLGFLPLAAALDPTVHYDRLACNFVLSVFGEDPAPIYEPLGDREQGIRGTPRRCPLLCAQPIPDHPAMPAGRHHQLVRATQAAFFQAYLLGDDAARCFLHDVLPREPDTTVYSFGARRPAALPPP